MNVQDIRTLYDYNFWANQRILAAARGAQPDAFTGAVLGYARLRDTLVHTFGGEWIWRSRWQGYSPTAIVDPNDFSTLAALVARWNEEEQHMRAFLEALTDTQLHERFTYQAVNGDARDSLLWHTMLHVITHGMQHRSEVAMLLSERGCSPGDIDLITYIRAQHP